LSSKKINISPLFILCVETFAPSFDGDSTACHFPIKENAFDCDLQELAITINNNKVIFFSYFI